MKNTRFYAIFFAAVLFVACEEEKIISSNELPATARTFIETHFPNVEIRTIVRETEGLDRDYTVYMENGFDIDFGKSGEWDDVDGHLSALPESILDLLPESILDYVSDAFPNSRITEVNKESYGYEIGLSTDIDLKFTAAGKFIEIDD
ncbi:MAG: PepSY-like domain-containing protein [Prevotellaceae bacterium]|jgi:hypothetical protein|nr:PepSY-like domain-containing protein [Prevotellaceae bacterium]